MNEKQSQLFPLLCSLLGRQQTLLGDALPTIHEIRVVLASGQQPSAEQLQAWKEKSEAFDKVFYEVSADLEQLYALAFDGVTAN